MTSMTDKPIRKRLALALLVAFVMAGAVLLIAKTFGVTSPYIVKPVSSRVAGEPFAKEYVFDSEARTLTVFSQSDLVVIADPGESFLYEAIWLARVGEESRYPGLMEFTFKLSKYADAKHIHGVLEKKPARIVSATEW